MEWDVSAFVSALAAIVIIDLVLAGDNAIVIALAARSLPKRLQRRAIVWGTLGAVAVRTALTVVVVWLLKIPGLLLAGGLLLVWIAYRLLLPEENEDGEAHAHSAAIGFWGAMRTIVVADAIMGLDNILGVAGAAHGNYLLVVSGLLISIPIMVWGSTLVLKLIDRFPVIAYLGAAVLAFTAAKMIVQEPFLEHFFAAYPLAAWPVYLLVPLVLWGGVVKSHRKIAARIQARLAEVALPARTAPPSGTKRALRVLLPVDGTGNAQAAVRHVLDEYQRNHELQVHLLNVQAPFSRHIARFASTRDRAAFHRERAEKALAPARGLLDAANVPCRTHCAVGNRAQIVSDMAHDLNCDHIVLAAARKNSLTRMIEDSTTDRVLELTQVPVEVIPGVEVSKFERYGVPLALVLTLALIIVLLLR